MDCAVQLDRVTKRFRAYRPHAPHTTLKTALVEWARGWSGRAGRTSPPDRFEVIRDASLDIAKGETIGLIGRNGAGKTTLLKMIAGIYRPDGGKLTVNGRVSALLELGAGFHPDFTGRENVMLSGIVHGLSKAEVRSRFDAIVDFSGIADFIDAPVRTYSAGMFMRLAFSVAIHVEPDILLIDEILSVGDEAFQRKSRGVIESRIRSRRQTTVIVSHDLGVIESLCDRVALLDPPTVIPFDKPAEAVAQFHRLMQTGGGDGHGSV